MKYTTRYPASPMPPTLDGAFYRFICITLIAVAVTFTVIITSAFVDIDGLLTRQNLQAVKKPATNFKPIPALFEEQVFPSSEDNDKEMESSMRNKRSIESNNLVYKLKSPKLKKILTNHLANLLEELDEDESSHAGKMDELPLNFNHNNVMKSNFITKEENVPKNEDVKEGNNENFKTADGNVDVLHLAMHNILLRGIIGHLDLNEVYEKVHLLIKNLEGHSYKELKKRDFKNKSTELMKIISENSNNEENKFFEELLNCQKLQKQISQIKNVADNERKTANDPLILIKAVIEVTDNGKIKENFTNSSKNVKGLIKILYNGKPTKIEEIVDNKDSQLEATQKVNNYEKGNSLEHSQPVTAQLDTKNENKPNSVFDHAISEYLKTHSIKLQNNHNILTKESFETKRLKRQIKVRYGSDKNTNEKSKPPNKNKKNHKDELYVEIETHFDGRGTKGEKKKKLVRSLIDKIQKAINSNIKDTEKDSKEKPPTIKKRTQNPIGYKEEIIVNTLPLVNAAEQRLLNPISKTVNIVQPLKSVLNNHGEEWKKLYNGPGFLTLAKSLNSAEMNELNIDYNSVMENGIPKRLQMPINTEYDDITKPNETSGNRNVTLYLKEIDGSGFTVGINQYADEPPDQESLQMFTGLENLIKAYHERYDQEDIVNNESIDRTDYRENNNRGFMKEYSNRHKRSAMNVKLFSNLKSKTKLNKFLNTNAMQTKKVFLKSKRNKRHVDKIRIVASDHYPKPESENIFLVSHEDIFADRAFVKEQDLPEVVIGDRDEEHEENIAPYENVYNIYSPHFQPHVKSAYDTKTLQTRLMSQYPHIFVENISKSKEEYLNINPMNHEILENNFRKLGPETILDTTTDNARYEKNNSLPSVEEIVNAILPRTNYKLTVKILPKNKSAINPGYKEVHTTINKSYDRNGLRYVSSVNVSEISKFENSNKSKEDGSLDKDTIANDEVQEQQNQIKLLLKLHKAGIDRQLEHLKMESQRLKGMIGKEDRDNMLKNISHIVDIFKQLGLTDFNAKGIVHSNEYKPNINKATTPKAVIANSETTIQPFIIENKQDDLMKAELMKTIKQNENITLQILQKIDNNTNKLQSFLQKLFDKLHLTQVNMETNNLLRKDTISPKHSEAIIPFIGEKHKNYSNPIPFIYAFQHPIGQNKDKSFKNVANVVYHGHIHASEADKNGKREDFFKDIANNFKIENSESQKRNVTTFFIDDLENDFKLAPNVNRIPTANITNKTSN